MRYCKHAASSAGHLTGRVHQCATKFMFGFEKCPDIGAVSTASVLLLDGFLWIFLKHQIMSYVLAFLV
jgi:hypothetical protein